MIQQKVDIDSVFREEILNFIVLEKIGVGVGILSVFFLLYMIYFEILVYFQLVFTGKVLKIILGVDDGWFGCFLYYLS